METTVEPEKQVLDESCNSNMGINNAVVSYVFGLFTSNQLAFLGYLMAVTLLRGR